jgi:hypothetical protein
VFETFAALPDITPDAAFVNGEVFVNDYVEITTDETHSNDSTKYRCTNIDGSGNIT